jgi:DNA-3-methyladenine glycosylase II
MKKALAHLKQADPVLAGVIARVGPMKMVRTPATFHFVVRSIAFQQLAGKAAKTIFDRLVAAAGNGPALTPEAILKLSTQRMRKCGLSRQKLSYIRDLAKKTQAGEVDFRKLPRMSDAEVIEHLTRVKGIGVWSAQMFLMFTLRRPDVLPSTDFGIQNAIRKHYGKRKLPKPKHVEKLGRAWHPYCSVASWYLWRSLDKKA